jgi:peptide chain release factor 1
MLDKLSALEEKYKDLEYKISDPTIIANQSEWQRLMKEHAEITPVIAAFREFRTASNQYDDAKEILETENDEEMRELAKMEIKETEIKVEELKERLRLLLLPKDPNDDKNVIVEIRAGAGGDEAGLFAQELQRLYMRYAERKRWKVDMMSTSENAAGGIKEAIFMINGKGAYSRLKFESGIHRVQRVPATESQGRIHTSTATVAVLPEVEDVEIEVRTQDLRVDVFRSSGNGGQSVNTTDSAVRITHMPSGIVVSCQDGKSQLANKEKAMQVLKAKLYEAELEKQQSEIAQDRKEQVGTGDRSGKIRTYNFPQGRITDHRIPLTLYKLMQFMDGEIDEMIDALVTMRQAEQMSQTDEM